MFAKDRLLFSKRPGFVVEILRLGFFCRLTEGCRGVGSRDGVLGLIRGLVARLSAMLRSGGEH